MALKDVVIKKEDGCMPEWGTLLPVKKEEDCVFETVVKSEPEEMLDADSDEYSADFPLDAEQHISLEETDPLSCPEKITIKSEPYFADEGITVSSTESWECQTAEVKLEDRKKDFPFDVGPQILQDGTTPSTFLEPSLVFPENISIKAESGFTDEVVSSERPEMCESPKDGSEEVENTSFAPTSPQSSDYTHSVQLKNRPIPQNFTSCHPSDKWFSCKTCAAQFKQRIELIRHNGHCDEKPFPCELCPARFKCKQYLRAHLISHSPEKPFSCQMCSKSFKRRRELRVHTRSFCRVFMPRTLT